MPNSDYTTELLNLEEVIVKKCKFLLAKSRFFLEQPGPLDTHGLRARLPDAGETAVQHHLQRRI